jgi:hypothetical protein
VAVPLASEIYEFDTADQQVNDTQTRDSAPEIVVEHDLPQRGMLDQKTVYLPDAQPGVNDKKDPDLKAEKYVEDIQQPVH